MTRSKTIKTWTNTGLFAEPRLQQGTRLICCLGDTLSPASALGIPQKAVPAAAPPREHITVTPTVHACIPPQSPRRSMPSTGTKSCRPGPGVCLHPWSSAPNKSGQRVCISENASFGQLRLQCCTSQTGIKGSYRWCHHLSTSFGTRSRIWWDPHSMGQTKTYWVTSNAVTTRGALSSPSSHNEDTIPGTSADSLSRTGGQQITL